MTKKSISSIIFHLDNRHAICHLSDEKAGQLFKAIMQYGYDGSLPNYSEDAMQGLFAMFQVQIDRNKEIYAETCERNKRNAESRYRKKSVNSVDEKGKIEAENPSCTHSDAVACDGIQTNASSCLYKYKTKDNNKNNREHSKDFIINETVNAAVEAESEYTFERIWIMYGKPVGDTEILKDMWDKLSEAEKEAIFTYVPRYIQSREVRYRKNFINFLSQKTWITEPIKEKINETNIICTASNGSRGENAKAEAIELIQEFFADNQPM